MKCLSRAKGIFLPAVNACPHQTPRIDLTGNGSSRSAGSETTPTVTGYRATRAEYNSGPEFGGGGQEIGGRLRTGGGWGVFSIIKQIWRSKTCGGLPGDKDIAVWSILRLVIYYRRSFGGGGLGGPNIICNPNSFSPPRHVRRGLIKNVIGTYPA